MELLDGSALVSRAVKAMRAAEMEEVVVVVGRAAGRVAKKAGGGNVRVVLNPEFRMGLSSSLRAGVNSLDSRSEAVVVCLADQPFVTSELIDRIIERHVETGAGAVAASSRGHVSPPVLLSRRLYGKIASLRGDTGAKAIALAEPTLERVTVDADILLDIDTDEELSRARELLRKQPSKPRGPAEDRRVPRRPSSVK